MSTYDPKYAKRWRLDQARGVKRFIDAAPARVHIENLAMQGASYRAIADAAGISVQAVCKLRDGQATVRRPTVAAILKVTYQSIFDRTGHEDFVPKIGAVRRLRALMAIGHRAQDIAAVVDMDWRMVHNVLNQPGQWISRERHVQIITAYDALWNKPGTSRHVLARAAAAGWPPPMAWDDETIDDPNAAPDLGHHHAPGGKRVHLEDIEWLLEDQPLATAHWLADRLGVTKDAIQQACRRADRTDLVDRLARNARLEGVAA